jgi:hypothetical protein
MTISRHISDFAKFAILILLAFGGIWTLGLVPLTGLPFWLGAGMLFIIGALLLVGILGMIWSLIEWFVAGAVTRRRSKTSPQEDLSHV